MSVYSDEMTPGQTVGSPTREPSSPHVDGGDMELYGRLKVASEQAVLTGVGDRALVCRPGLIVGPGDPTGRFAYWPERLSRGGEVAAPGGPDELVQVIDVRDLAAWLLASIERSLVGTYDAVSPPMARSAFLAEVARGVGTDPKIVWMDETYLAEQKVEPWMGPRSLPVWVPMSDYAGFMAHDVTATIQAGLVLRPLSETSRDTLAWLRENPDSTRTGLTAAEEDALVDAWRHRASPR
jgi:nucleoside-diphosphate-sugar epimerase